MTGTLVVGSEAHKELFCRSFIDTHDPYDPAQLPFPDIGADSRARLLSLPIWDEAVNTELETAKKHVSVVYEESAERCAGGVCGL